MCSNSNGYRVIEPRQNVKVFEENIEITVNFAITHTKPTVFIKIEKDNKVKFQRTFSKVMWRQEIEDKFVIIQDKYEIRVLMSTSKNVHKIHVLGTREDKFLFSETVSNKS